LGIASGARWVRQGEKANERVPWLRREGPAGDHLRSGAWRAPFAHYLRETRTG